MVVELTPTAADGTLEGYAQAVAVELAEPLGTVVSRVRRDEWGVQWVGIPPGAAIPALPPAAIRQLGIDRPERDMR